MPRLRLEANVAAAGIILACGPAFAADVRCPDPYVRAAELPQAGFWNYGGLKRRAPNIPSCDKVSPLDECSVLDPWGYEDTFGQVIRVPEFTGPKQRLLERRTAHRSHKPRLPYGVLWSDAAPVVMRKLKAFGADPRQGRGDDNVGVEILVGGCGRDNSNVGFLTIFHFDDAGRLQTVTRMDEPD